MGLNIMPRPHARTLYAAPIRAHAARPHGARLPAGSEPLERSNPLCGDRVRLVATRRDSCLDTLACEVRGCQLCVASASMMCETLQGREMESVRDVLASVLRLSGTSSYLESWPPGMDSLAAVHSFPERVRCVTLPWEALEHRLTVEVTS